VALSKLADWILKENGIENLAEAPATPMIRNGWFNLFAKTMTAGGNLMGPAEYFHAQIWRTDQPEGVTLLLPGDSHWYR